MAKKKRIEEEDEPKQDLTVAGPGSPISMAKALKAIDLDPNDPKRRTTVFIDGTGVGFELDEPSMLNLTAQARADQTEWWVDNVFNKLTTRDIPAYLYRYLHYLFIDKGSGDKEWGQMKYNSDLSFRGAIKRGELDMDKDPDYCYIHNLIKYSKTNPEAKMAIGLIQLVAGSLKGATKANAGIRLYIEHPEIHMHPARERLLMSLLEMLRNEFGPPENEVITKTNEDE